MLHIILLILKIIGITLGCIIGLVLLLVLAVLFISVKYRASAAFSGALSYTLKGFWIPGILHFKVTNESGKNRFVVRIFGFPLFDTAKEKKPPVKKTEAAAVKNELPKRIEPSKNAHTEKEVQAERKLPASDEVPLPEEIPVTEEVHTFREVPVPEDMSDVKEVHTMAYERPGKKQSVFTKLKQLWDKIKHINEHMLKKARDIADKCRALKGKTDKLNDIFLGIEGRQTIGRVKVQLYKLIGHLKFKKVLGRLHYGFDDPAVTGKCLGYLGMLYPIYSPGIVIEPDFENKVLEGDLCIRGRIRLFNLLVIALKLVLDKGVKKMIHDVKNL